MIEIERKVGDANFTATTLIEQLTTGGTLDEETRTRLLKLLTPEQSEMRSDIPEITGNMIFGKKDGASDYCIIYQTGELENEDGAVIGQLSRIAGLSGCNLSAIRNIKGDTARRDCFIVRQYGTDNVSRPIWQVHNYRTSVEMNIGRQFSELMKKEVESRGFSGDEDKVRSLHNKNKWQSEYPNPTDWEDWQNGIALKGVNKILPRNVIDACLLFGESIYISSQDAVLLDANSLAQKEADWIIYAYDNSKTMVQEFLKERSEIGIIVDKDFGGIYEKTRQFCQNNTLECQTFIQKVVKVFGDKPARFDLLLAQTSKSNALRAVKAYLEGNFTNFNIDYPFAKEWVKNIANTDIAKQCGFTE